MVRTYKRLTNRANIDESTVARALTEIRHGRLSIRAAAAEFGLKKSMLHKRLKKEKGRGYDSGAEMDENQQQPSKSKYASNQIFTGQEEKLLNAYLLKCSSIHYGLTYLQTRTLAYEYSVKLNKKIPEKWTENKQAGIDWMKSFMKRNANISLRKPENTSLARATSFNEANVATFFKNYKQVLKQYSFKPNRILNLDESGITTVLPCPKVLSERGKKQVGQIVSAERGQLVTFVGIITANGNSLPPAYIFPRVNSKDHFVNGGPSGALALAHKSGWMTAELFINVLQHVKNHMLPTKENPILLLIDNHESHISVAAVCFCKENGIVLLSFPPHCSHRLQPLDVGVYGPFKSMLKTSFNNHMAANPAKPISIYDIPTLSKQPFISSFTPHNITKAFEKTGLWPLNDLIFTETDFQCSYATDRDLPNAEVHSASSNPTMEPGPSGIVQVTPEVVRPLPKAAPRKNTGRAKGKSCIFTSTPELEKIKEKHAMKIKTSKKKSVQRAIFNESSSSTSSEDLLEPEYNDTSEDDIDEGISDDHSVNVEDGILDDEIINVNDYVVVKFTTKKRIVHYVAQIKMIHAAGQEYDVTFLRKNPSSFTFSYPTTDDEASIRRDDIISKLGKPLQLKGTARTSTFIEFDKFLKNYNFV